MKNLSSALIVLMIFLFSCSSKEEHSALNQVNLQVHDSIPRPEVSILANLPDSLQPKTISLAETPQALTIVIPTKIGQTYNNAIGATIKMEPPVIKMLPILKNAAGQPVLDTAGRPFILGDGSVSHFTTYTTEDGLALDGVLSSYLDSRGHLWFGTEGGGVSRYDGIGFTTYTTDQGLANNVVWSITQDQAGRLWFGTNGGVSRYDGTDFTTYTTTQGLAGNLVWSITEDQAGRLWFGTNGGVSRYDPDKHRDGFTTYTTAQGLASNEVASITQDQAGNLWFGTGGGGVSRYDPDKHRDGFTTYTTAQGLAGNYVLSITEDQAGRLWFGTGGGGVSRYDGTGFTTYTTTQGLAGNLVWSITEDQAGRLWFGTNGGVSRYDPDKHRDGFTNYTTAYGLASNFVWSITEDQAGRLWFGTRGGGVRRYDGTGFTSYTTTQGLASNHVWSITEDQAGRLWFGTEGGGVSRYDPDKHRDGFTSYTTAQGLASNEVASITEDQAGRLWFGTWGDGVSRYDGTGFTNYTTAQGLAGNVVLSITEDQAGRLWFGTRGGGVSRYDGTGFTTYTTAQGLASNLVWSITEDQAGRLWFGTEGGVSRYDGTGFTTYTTAQGLASNHVSSITEDQAGNLWFGTDGGLSFLTKAQMERSEGQLFQSFTTANGLADNTVTEVLQLPDGKMAIGSNQGITLFDPPQGPAEDFTTLSGIEHYNSQGGYPVKNVNRAQHAMYLDSKGIIWIGTGSDQTALVRFDYQAVHKNTAPPAIRIRQIQLNREAICWHDLQDRETQTTAIDPLQTPAYLTEETTTLGRCLNDEERRAMQQKYAGVSFDSIIPFYYVPENLVLPYRNNNITFHYGTGELARPNSIEYQYQLEAYDKDWSPVLKNTEATFGNIQEGSYTFKVKARYTGPSLEGAKVWTEPMRYSFRVLPPWYRSWWAYSLYTFVAFGILWLIRRSELQRLTAKTEARQSRELAASKTRLYTNITHEFRTPLTVILGMVRQIVDDPQRWLQKGSQMIIRNGEQLLKLVNQMLDLSKLDEGHLPVQFIRDDLIRHLKYLTDTFKTYADTKDIRLHFLTKVAELQMDFDPEKVQTIVSNLVDNAIKFTAERGDIYLSVDRVRRVKDDDFLEIRIKDNGIGIPAKQLPYIFDRFFQADAPHPQQGEPVRPLLSEGTGIGLALTKELVKLMGGSIAVSSQEKMGTEFTIQLPIRQEARAGTAEELAPPLPTILVHPSQIIENNITEERIPASDRPLALLIEDNQDVLHYLKSFLAKQYDLETASNGIEGIEKAIRLIPDIIISDVMMPGKDGFEVVNTLKEDERTGHIPIILLTAKADLASRLQGLEQGADAYLSKPFDRKELEVRLRTLLKFRQKLQARYRQLDFTSPAENPTTTKADGFIIRLRALVEQHIEDENFGILQICHELGSSRSQLHRKLKALTGKSTSKVIRTIRLQKARKLLESSDMNVSEVGYNVGFTNRSHFTTNFTEEFGVSPGVYKKNHQRP